jgi:hypothetical protein
MGFALLLVGVSAHAVDCTVKDSAGYDYDITLKGNMVDVTTSGAGWDFTFDNQQSTATTKYYFYQNPSSGASLVFISENGRVSLYDYRSKIYYFQNESCALSAGGSRLVPPPPAYRPPSFGGNKPSSGAVALPGGQFTPLPSGPNGSYEDVSASFTPARSIGNPKKHGIACDYVQALRAHFCETDSHSLVIHQDRVELTMKSDGTQYMLPKQRLSSCSYVGPFCEELFAIDPNWISVGVGHTNGIQLYVTVGGPSQNFSYEYPDTW